MPQFSISTLAAASLLLADFAAGAAATCYRLDGTPFANIRPDDGDWVPCDPSAAGASSCCSVKDYCLGNGLCLDAEGCLWVAMVQDSEYVRIDPDGEVIERIASHSPFALACVLGGPDRRHLFLDSADTSMERLRKGDSVGRIDVVEVAVAGTGLP